MHLTPDRLDLLLVVQKGPSYTIVVPIGGLEVLELSGNIAHTFGPGQLQSSSVVG